MHPSKEDYYLSIINGNKESIYRICSSFSVDADHAKDLSQEVFFHLWKSLETFQEKSHKKTWIYRITLNICLRDRTSVKKKMEHFVSLDSLDFIEPIIEESHAGESDFVQLYKCIKKIKVVDRTVILLHLEELSHKEIGEVCEMTENHVAVKIKRINEKLHKCLET